MSAEEVVDGLAVRDREVPCNCGCRETHNVVLIAVPGDDRWTVGSIREPDVWPARRLLRGTEEAHFEVCERLIAMLGAPWDELTDEVLLAQARLAIDLRNSPMVLRQALATPVEELRLMANAATPMARVAVTAAHQAATS